MIHDKDEKEMRSFVYILFPKDTEEDCIKEQNQLGEFRYPKVYLRDNIFHRKCVFYRNRGFFILEELIGREHPGLDLIRIISSKGKKYTIESFLDSLENVELK